MTKEELDGDRIFVIHDFLSQADCVELIRRSEGLAWVWEESHLTFMVYLNDQMAGGQTRFFGGMEEAFRGQPYLSVQPKEGTALVFVHRIWHEGAVLESGQKYVLRTDVMYGRPAEKRI